jgi:hypothetical protein
MGRREELEKQIRELSAEHNALVEIDERAEDRKLLGCCFKYRNNYSCPESDADYWWLYLKITSADDGLMALTFEVDKNGRITIDPCHHVYRRTLLSGYTEIKASELSKAWDRCITAAQAANRS